MRPPCVECGKVPAWGDSYDKCCYCLGIYCKHNRDPKNPGYGGCGRQAGPSGYCYKHNPVSQTRYEQIPWKKLFS